MRLFKIGLVLALGLVAQAAMTNIRPADVGAEVLLVVAIAAGIAGGPDVGVRVGFAAGAAADLLLTTPFGLASLVYSIVGYAIGHIGLTVVRSAWWIPVVTAAAGSAVGMILFFVAAAMLGLTHLIDDRLIVVSLVVGLLNGVIAVGVMPLVSWALHEPGIGSRTA